MQVASGHQAQRPSHATREALIATIHLVEGPVGAGKSTFAARLAVSHGAPHLNLDEWMVTLFSPDRPAEGFMEWYAQRKARCLEQIWKLTCELLDNGNDAILELGLVRLADREAFYQRVDGTDYPLRVYLLEAPLELRRQWVRDRNRERTDTYRMNVSDEIFELANRFWEEPATAEIRERNMEVVSASR